MSSCNNNGESKCCAGVINTLAVLGALLVVAGIVWAMKHYTTPASLTAERAALRAKNLAELQAEETKAMTTYDWVDKTKGIVRLKVDRAVQMTIAGNNDPAGFRKDLLAREAKATFVPPKPPEKPSAFE
jgi:hypothetical protein